MTTTRKHWTWFWLTWAVWLFASVAISRADTLQLYVSSAFSPSQQVMAGRVQALFGEKLVADRGLDGPTNLMGLTLRSVYIDGAPPTPNIWSQGYGGSWRPNRDVKYVFDGAGKIDMDSANHPSWSDELFSIVLFHEVCHFYGFDPVIWFHNGNMPESGRYVGIFGLDAFRLEREALAAWVPVTESHFDQNLQPWIMTPYLSGNYVSRTLVQMLKDNGNTLTPWAESFQGGSLASILPRRGLRPIIIYNQ